MEFKKLLTDPIAVAVTFGIALMHALGLGFIDPLLAVLWANLPNLFTASSIAGLTLAPRVEWLPSEPLTLLAIVLGALYVLRLLYRVYRDFERSSDS